MAIQSGIIQFRGKLGRVVGMKNGFNSGSTRAANFMRQLADEIGNPQTDAQMVQRVKMLPAVLFNRQLSEVIRRAWEGVEYGGPSTRKFMQYAMKEPFANVPQLPKDSTVAIPGEYLISRGSLPTIGGVISESGAPEFRTTLQAQVPDIRTATVGALSESLIERNSFLRLGDQLTFIMVTAPDDLAYCQYKIASIYLDDTNNVSLSEATGNNIEFSAGGTLGFVPMTGTPIGYAVVLSRDGETTYQRSTQRMVVDKNILASYFASTLKPSIANTYRSTTKTRTTNWPYQNDGEAPSTSGRVIIEVQVNPTDGGTVTGAGRYNEGDTVNLTATPAEGFSFVGWKAGTTVLSTAQIYAFAAASSLSIVAEFSDVDRP